jgi:branched-chain amino acid transport system ATP-binding protein
MEGRSIFPSLSVREKLLLQAPAGADKSEIMDRTNQEFPQLTKRGKQLAGTLSGSEQQMLALMRAYLARPRVVLADEASLGLAPVIVDQIFAFLQHIAGDGVSLLIVEQYAHRVLAIASAVYLLSQGSIVYSGPAGELDEEQIFALYAQQSAPSIPPGGRDEI